MIYDLDIQDPGLLDKIRTERNPVSHVMEALQDLRNVEDRISNIRKLLYQESIKHNIDVEFVELLKFYVKEFNLINA